MKTITVQAEVTVDQFPKIWVEANFAKSER